MQKFILEKALLPDGWASNVYIAVNESGDLVDVQPGTTRHGVSTVKGFAAPGIPNVHSHAFQRALSGLTEYHSGHKDSFWGWRELMYRFVNTISVEDIYSIAAQVYLEMLSAGYTAVAEFHYVHNQPDGGQYSQSEEISLAIRQAALDTGIHLTLLPVLYIYSGFNKQPLRDEQRRFYQTIESFCKLYESLSPLFTDEAQLQLGMALHSLRAVSPDEITCLLDFVKAINPSAPVHIHIAEQEKEVEDCINWSGMRPVQWLLEHQSVDEKWCLIHATHLTGTEVTDLAQTGAVVGLCPTTEANLGDGLFPLESYLENNGKIAIGSDSNVSVNPIEELRWLEYGQRLSLRRRNIIAKSPFLHSGKSLFIRCVEGGAQACAINSGVIAPGYRADIVCLDSSMLHLFADKTDYILDSVIFNGNERLVKNVMVGGQWAINDCKHSKIEDINHNFLQTLKKLYSILD